MNKLLRSFLILLLLLSAKTGFAAPVGITLTTLLSLPAQQLTQRQQHRHDRVGLTALDQTLSAPALQPTDNLSQLYQLAPVAQMELSQLLSQAAVASQTEMHLADIKTRSRASQKISGKLAGDTRQLTDLVRGTLVADSISDLMQSYDFLQQQGEILQLKNRFASPKHSGYRDLNLLVRLPQSGMVAEIQLHLRKIADIKSGVEHQVYQQVQAIEFGARRASRELTELERARIIRLQQDSHKQYHKAWLYYKRLDDSMQQAA
ncbi:GTP pyrophosphokinase [Shewanella sp. NFH-SH190041]|uniref:RelA/SpoT domain-containing protein n=1 Tax=Shewanella sp. NFH-SH190041 TaxID=2950245 RepID=UPI0021C3F71E|nr:RelA/SpoT domain-containing protein [Shewanella sp. NFH-SH190041]BDM65679.1 GTP pyrophosphokinase [Shewanella sp. NFH-SH190041]